MTVRRLVDPDGREDPYRGEVYPGEVFKSRLMDRRQFLKTGLATLGILGGAPLLISCGGALAPSGNQSSKETVAFSFLYSEVPAAAAVKRFAKERAKQLDYELLTDNITGGKTDEQLTSVNSFITRDVGTLVVHVVDPSGYGGLISRARDAEIPFFTYASAVPESDGAVLFPPQEAAEELSQDAANWVKENLDGEEAQVLVLGFTADPVTRKATETLSQGITEQGLGRVVASQDALEQATGLRITEDVLKANPGINVVLCQNDGGALGACQAFSKTDKDPAKVYVASNEGTELGIQAMLDGNKYLKTINQLSIKKIGYAVTDIAHRYFTDGKKGDIVIGRRILHNDQKEELRQALTEY